MSLPGFPLSLKVRITRHKFVNKQIPPTTECSLGTDIVLTITHISLDRCLRLCYGKVMRLRNNEVPASNVNRPNIRQESTDTMNKSHCPAKFNMINATHSSIAPIQCGSAIAYVSGSRQVTEFRVSDTGFMILVWSQSRDESETICIFAARKEGVDTLYQMLEKDVLGGHARLSDRASVRGVGLVHSSTPFAKRISRDMTRATDDVGCVINWLRRAEAWFDARMLRGKTEVLSANLALLDEGGSTFVPTRVSLGRRNAGIRPTNDGEMTSNKCWDNIGALAVRGKRTYEGSTSKTIVNKRERIARLQATLDFQLRSAQECSLIGNIEDEVEYNEMAEETRVKIETLQGQVNARMQHARSCRKTNTTVVKFSDSATEALKDATPQWVAFDFV